MFPRRISTSVVGLVSAFALAGCAAEAMSTSNGLGVERSERSQEADDGSEVGVESQALGGFSHLLPRRGSLEDLVESRFLGSGMTYAIQLRTGALVDAISASFYTPSLSNNRYSSGDPFFVRGPTGATAGSAQPRLECPAGFAASGLCGRSGTRLDELGLLCAQIGSDGRPVAGSERPIGAYGGDGGNVFLDSCGAGKWLTGMAVYVALKSSGTNKIVSAVQGYCSNAN